MRGNKPKYKARKSVQNKLYDEFDLALHKIIKSKKTFPSLHGIVLNEFFYDCWSVVVGEITKDTARLLLLEKYGFVASDYFPINISDGGSFSVKGYVIGGGTKSPIYTQTFEERKRLGDYRSVIYQDQNQIKQNIKNLKAANKMNAIEASKELAASHKAYKKSSGGI